MCNVFDVARYILRREGSMTSMKLQKLVYYCQAWSLVWDEKLLFREKIYAWSNGPVIRRLYDEHKGKFQVNANTFREGKVKNLSKRQKEIIDSVLNYYGSKEPQWLSDLTHMEHPWKNARKGILDGERGNNEITPATMNEYYGSLEPNN